MVHKVTRGHNLFLMLQCRGVTPRILFIVYICYCCMDSSVGHSVILYKALDQI
uniref:Uncharacterized protein n=1 Tax=Anguilla anguilla TaxID=7936 RepID=A0A0E9WUH2_ANGAN